MKNDDKDSLLVYEAVVPIVNVLGPNWKTKAAKKQFSVNVALNAAPAMGGVRRPSRGLELRGIGGGMRGGRNHGGAGGGPVLKEEDSWYTFRLPMK
jgi:hypothetical protein